MYSSSAPTGIEAMKHRCSASTHVASVEEGLLEKIINFSLANLRGHYKNQWRIISIKTPTSRQMLYRLLDHDNRIWDADSTLIILSNDAAFDIKPLVFAIQYAAKFYNLDVICFEDISSKKLELLIKIFPGEKVAGMLCLGHFPCMPEQKSDIPHYRDIVSEV